MHIALIGDAFPPMRTSGAVQLRDLSQEFVRHKHFLTVMIPSPDMERPWLLENMDGVQGQDTPVHSTRSVMDI